VRVNGVSISGTLMVLGVAFTAYAAVFVGKVLPKETSVPQPAKSLATDADSAEKIGSTSKEGNKSGEQTYPSFGLGTTGPEVLALNERLAELGYLPVEISGESVKCFV
jgi:peptidoglycan hydrolase-like protein with peptidoglycan-binding domain